MEELFLKLQQLTPFDILINQHKYLDVSVEKAMKIKSININLEIDTEIYNKMVATDTMYEIRLSVFQNSIFHYDLEKALHEAILLIIKLG